MSAKEKAKGKRRCPVLSESGRSSGGTMRAPQRMALMTMMRTTSQRCMPQSSSAMPWLWTYWHACVLCSHRGSSCHPPSAVTGLWCRWDKFPMRSKAKVSRQRSARGMTAVLINSCRSRQRGVSERHTRLMRSGGPGSRNRHVRDGRGRLCRGIRSAMVHVVRATKWRIRKKWYISVEVECAFKCCKREPMPHWQKAGTDTLLW